MLILMHVHMYFCIRRAESQSGLTHVKYIPTYQFGNTLILCVLGAGNDSCF